MSLCAIMQPTYLPWSGYFNLIASVEKFVFLDSVQFEKQSWQSRNRILANGCEQWLSLPVKRGSLTTNIGNIELSQSLDWRRKHLSALTMAYNRAPYGRDIIELLEHVFSEREYLNLADVNISIIRSIAAKLNIQTQFFIASELDCRGKRSELLLSICKAVNSKTYLSPKGAAEYLDEDGFASAGDIRLVFQSFRPPPYKQFRSKDFISHLSIVDVIANIGFDSASRYCCSSGD